MVMRNTVMPGTAVPGIPREKNMTGSIFIDLPCFMERMNIMNKHTDNMMIDLSLLTSNLKSCAYVNKKDNESVVSPESSLIDNITKSIDIPKPGMVKLMNVPATVLVTTNTQNPQVVGMSREPFTSEQQYYPTSDSQSTYDLTLFSNSSCLLSLIIIIFIIYMIFYRK